MTKVLEICTQDYSSIKASAAKGAHRIELCSSLETGGLTPSIGLIESALELSGPEVYVLIRPRTGYFTHKADEFKIMLRDAELALNAGAHGIVSGFLTAEASIDKVQTKEMLNLCADRGFTFHRAFDLLDDQFEGMEELIDLGVKRILSSGQERNAEAGKGRLTELINRAAGRISIMPGSGIHSGNIAEIMETGAHEFHLSAQRLHAYEVNYQGKDLFSTAFRSSNADEIQKCLEIISA